jgi:hypothetical protein
MPYDRYSPYTLVGAWAEGVIRARAIAAGWWVLHTSEAAGPGATMVEGPDGKVVMPDLQLFDLYRGRGTRFVEVKAKQGAYRWQKDRLDCTGVDWPNWLAYNRLNDSGVPVDLALIHLRWPMRWDSLRPKLLWQTVDALKLTRYDTKLNGLIVGPMHVEQCEEFPRGLAAWSQDDFINRGDLDLPPQHIIDALAEHKVNLHAWEANPDKGRLLRPRTAPRQFDLFAKRDDEATGT